MLALVLVVTIYFLFCSLFIDFNLITKEVIVTATDTKLCVSFIALADNLALEGQEMLTLSLSGPDNVIVDMPTVTIGIDDTDGMYTHTHEYFIAVKVPIVAFVHQKSTLYTLYGSYILLFTYNC